MTGLVTGSVGSRDKSGAYSGKDSTSWCRSRQYYSVMSFTFAPRASHRLQAFLDSVSSLPSAALSLFLSLQIKMQWTEASPTCCVAPKTAFLSCMSAQQVHPASYLRSALLFSASLALHNFCHSTILRLELELELEL